MLLRVFFSFIDIETFTKQGRIIERKQALYKKINAPVRGIRKSGTKEHFHVIFHIGDAIDPEVIHEDLGHVRRQECRKRRAQMDIFDAKIQQGKQHDYRFLLIPGNVVGNRQLVDILQAEYFLQLECNDFIRPSQPAMTKNRRIAPDFTASTT